MKEQGLYERETFAPMPGTDKDPQGIPNPAGYVDDVTMRNRAELFLRAHNAGHHQEFDPKEAGVLGEQYAGPIAHRDVMAITTNTNPTRQSRVGRRLRAASHSGS